MTIEEYLKSQKESPDRRLKVPAEVVMELRRRTGLGVLDAKHILEEAASSAFSERRMTAYLTQGGTLLHDPIQEDPALRSMFENVEEMVDDELKDEERRLGFCYLYWHTKKRILKEEFGIEWFTPGEMNPHVFFD